MEDDDEDRPKGVSSLRARFEQLNDGPAAPSPTKPKPVRLASSFKDASTATAIQHSSDEGQERPSFSTESSSTTTKTTATTEMTRSESPESMIVLETTATKRRAAPPPPPPVSRHTSTNSVRPAPAAAAITEAPARPSLPPSIPPRPVTTTTTTTTKSKSQDDGPPLPARPATRSPAPPALPSRPSSATARPRPRPRAASDASSALTAVDVTDFKPLPPPVRLVNMNVPPKRPASTSIGKDDSSDDDDNNDNENDTKQQSATSRAQEYPDSTFANRRPPTLTGRHPVRAAHHFNCFDVRGNTVVTGHAHLSVWHPGRTSARAANIILSSADIRITALLFVAPAEAQGPCRTVWCGTREGHMYIVDIESDEIVEHKPYAHNAPVTHLLRVTRDIIISIDDSGKVHRWSGTTLSSPPEVFRLGERPSFTGLVGSQLWTAYGPATVPSAATSTSMSTSATGKGPLLRIWDPTTTSSLFALTPKPVSPAHECGAHLGSVTASAVVPLDDAFVYLAHSNGYVSKWDRASFACTHVQRIAPFSITSAAGVGRYLWTGFRNGFVNVYDVLSDPWIVRKAFKAHVDQPVQALVVDPASLWTDNVLQVASCALDSVEFWDGFLRTDWMERELDLRQRDFCTFRTLKTLSVSWNVDAQRPTDLVGSRANLDFFVDCLSSVDSPDIIAFTFQELIDLENKKLTAKSMLLGAGRKRADSQFTDKVSSAYRQWHDKLVQQVRLVMPPECPYAVVHAGDLVGLFTCVFVKQGESRALRDVAIETVKTGVGGRYGNKGAILSRFVIDDTSVCFVNCHLAAGQAHRIQRDKDLADILETRGAFSELGEASYGAYASGGTGTNVFDHEVVFVAGDLNYRIDGRRDAVLSAIENGRLDTLLGQDQLLRNLATNQSFRLRSFKEPPIKFPPTYKGTDEYDSGPKKRIPAWCDRILYRADTADKVVPLHYERYEVNVSDHRPISAAFEVRVKKINAAKRAVVWDEVHDSWLRVEEAALQEARAWYAKA